MTNALFDPAREGFLKGEIRWDGTAVVKALLVRGYTFDASDKFVSDLTGATVHVTSNALTGQTATNGVADANDVSGGAFDAVASNGSNHVIILAQTSAVTGGADVATSAQRLIAFIDTGTNFPIVPNGGDVSVAWDNGANKIFKL